MSAQLPLVLEPRRLSRASDPQTSHAAAERASEFKASHDGLIWNCLVDHGGLIKDEISSLTKLSDIQVARRLSGLEERGLVRRELLYVNAQGQSVYWSRSNDKGRQCAIWWAIKG